MCLQNKTDNPKDSIHQELQYIQSSKIQLWEFQCLKSAHLWARKEKVGAENQTQLPKATFHGVLRQEIETWCKTYFPFLVPWKYSSADWQRGCTEKISGSAKTGLIRLLENLQRRCIKFSAFWATTGGWREGLCELLRGNKQLEVSLVLIWVAPMTQRAAEHKGSGPSTFWKVHWAGTGLSYTFSVEENIP